MGSLTKREALARGSLYEIGYKFIHDNFHKFSLSNKIRVAIKILEIFEKDDSKTVNPTTTVIVEIAHENKTTQESGNRISEYLEI